MDYHLVDHASEAKIGLRTIVWGNVVGQRLLRRTQKDTQDSQSKFWIMSNASLTPHGYTDCWHICIAPWIVWVAHMVVPIIWHLCWMAEGTLRSDEWNHYAFFFLYYESKWIYQIYIVDVFWDRNRNLGMTVSTEYLKIFNSIAQTHAQQVNRRHWANAHSPKSGAHSINAQPLRHREHLS